MNCCQMTAVEHGDQAVYRRSKNRERATKHPPAAGRRGRYAGHQYKVLTAAAKAAARELLHASTSGRPPRGMSMLI
jgi:hypothetical protein